MNPNLHKNEIATQRLRLRRFSDDDAERVKALAGDKSIAATTLLIPHPYHLQDAKNWISTHQEDLNTNTASNFAIQQDGRLIGAISLSFKDSYNRAELGYWVGKPYWGCGYCSEAAKAMLAHGFNDLKLNRIYAYCFKTNSASNRILEKIGMKMEGCMRQHIKKWGNYIDLNIWGILARAYPKTPGEHKVPPYD